MFRLYLIGLFILITAIIANYIVSKLHLKSWYDLLNGIINSRSYWSEVTLKDGLWLFVLYPLFLGLGSSLGNFIYIKLFSS